MNWRDFMCRIEDPSSKPLQDLLWKARRGVVDQLVDEGGERLDENKVWFRGSELGTRELDKFAYTFYFDWEQPVDPDYVFLVQNPGRLVAERHLDEATKLIEAIHSDDPYISQVRCNQDYLQDWLWSRNQKFSRQFFPLLKKYGLISMDNTETYLEDGFFSDFMLTDLVKYRVRTEELEGKRGGNADISYRDFLRPELEAYDPDIVFAFGSRNWKTFLRNVDLQPAAAPDDVLKDTVTDAHGYLFQSDGMNVIPLNHFSGRNTFLRDSYFDYLEEGIRNYREQSS